VANFDVEKLESKEFLLAGTKHKFYLGFFPNPKSGKYSSLFLCAKNMIGDDNVRVRYSLWIENNQGEKIGETGKF
jgi:hypothetical protein